MPRYPCVDCGSMVNIRPSRMSPDKIAVCFVCKLNPTEQTACIAITHKGARCGLRQNPNSDSGYCNTHIKHKKD